MNQTEFQFELDKKDYHLCKVMNIFLDTEIISKY
jgi:hypothetical protein